MRFSAVRFNFELLLACVAAGCAAACVVIPTGGNIDDKQVQRIELGVTTLDDAISIVGPPTFIWENRQIAVFDEGTTAIWIVFAGTGAGGEFGDQVFLARYRNDGVIVAVEKKMKPLLDNGWVPFLEKWAEGTDSLQSDMDEQS